MVVLSCMLRAPYIYLCTCACPHIVLCISRAVCVCPFPYWFLCLLVFQREFSYSVAVLGSRYHLHAGLTVIPIPSVIPLQLIWGQSCQSCLECCHWPCLSLTNNVPMRLLNTQPNFCPPSQARGVPEVLLVFKSLIGSTSICNPNLIIFQITINAHPYHLNTIHRDY
jgi:hypothetical protein